MSSILAEGIWLQRFYPSLFIQWRVFSISNYHARIPRMQNARVTVIRRNNIRGDENMKKRNQIDSALLNDILRVTNQAQPQTILSIKSVIDEFQRFNMAKGLSEWTISFYAKETKAFIRSLVALEIDSENIAKITTDDIQRFVEYQFELKRARTTINSRLRAIKTMFQYVVTKNHIPINPATAIPNVRVRHVVGDMFSRSQLNQLMKQPDISTTVGVRDYTIMMMFAHSGIRLSELAAIRTQDVYFEDNYFIVQRAKNTYARRIPLTKQLRATLRKMSNVHRMSSAVIL